MAEITLESPPLEPSAAFEPPFLCLGDPVVVAPRPADGRPAGVIVLTLDALSRNHASGGGYRRPTTPNLDRLMSEGAFFLHAMAPTPSTYTSLPSFLSSSHRRDSWQEFLSNLDTESPTLPEVFGAQGHRTAVFIRDIYFNSFWKGVNVRPYPYTRPRLTAEEIDDAMTDRLIAWIKSVREQHFFAWMHLNQPHGPNRPSPQHDLFRDQADAAPSFRAIEQFMTGVGVPGAKGLAETAEQISLHREDHDPALVRHAEVVIEALYDGSIHEADALVERVVDALRGEGLLDSTLLAIASDHGWPLVPVFHPEAIGPDAEYEVPLILRGPGVPAGQRIGERVSLVDLGPTLLDLAGLAAPPTFEGSSLRPLVHGGTLGLRLVAAQKKEVLLGYLGAAKIVLPRPSLALPAATAIGTASFFDLGLDPDSTRPLPAAGEPLARQAYEALIAWHSAPRTAFRERRLTEALKGFLREAGYLKDEKATGSTGEPPRRPR
ncbi:MAG: sulfatase-like hydrolase/transferase [Planctomycetota bacterium]